MDSPKLLSSEAKLVAERHLHDTADQLAAILLDKRYPGQEVSVAKKISRESAVVYLVDNPVGRDVLRLSTHTHYAASHIAWAHQQWTALGVPVPKVYEFGAQDGVQYLFMEYVPTEAFNFDLPPEVQLGVMRQMGELLARMHTVSASSFGYLDHQGNGTFDTWQQFLATRFNVSWMKQYLTGTELAVLTKFLAEPSLANVEPVLLHDDFKPGNMFINQSGTIVAVTDPQPIAGDALWDVAWCNHFVYREQARQNQPFDAPWYQQLRQTFVEAYRTCFGPPTV